VVESMACKSASGRSCRSASNKPRHRARRDHRFQRL
jgi:hypothetical protein